MTVCEAVEIIHSDQEIKGFLDNMSKKMAYHIRSYDRDDAYQAIMERVCFAIKNYKETNNFKGFVRTVAYRTAMEVMRSDLRTKRPKFVLDSVSELERLTVNSDCARIECSLLLDEIEKRLHRDDFRRAFRLMRSGGKGNYKVMRAAREILKELDR